MTVNSESKKEQRSLIRTINRVALGATDRFGAKFAFFAFWIILIAGSRVTLGLCEISAIGGIKMSDALPSVGRFCFLLGGAVGVFTYALLLLAFCCGVLATTATVLECHKIAHGWRGLIQFIWFTTLFGVAAGLPIFLGMKYGERSVALHAITDFGQFLIDNGLILLVMIIVAVCAVFVRKIVIWRKSQ